MTAYDRRISDWSSYVCSSDLGAFPCGATAPTRDIGRRPRPWAVPLARDRPYLCSTVRASDALRARLLLPSLLHLERPAGSPCATTSAAGTGFRSPSDGVPWDSESGRASCWERGGPDV